MSSTIRIATIDDHPIFLAGLKQSLQRAKDIKVVAEGHCATDARKIAREDSPDIILLDVGIEGGGIQAAGAILAENAAAKIVMLTADDDEHTVASAIQTGVSGYLLKGTPAGDLVAALRDVYRGVPCMTPSVSARHFLHNAQSRARQSAALVPSTRDALTHREQQVLDLLSQGSTNQEIAGQLNLSTPTIKNYMSRIFEKLSVRNRAEAISKHLQQQPSTTR